VTSLTPKSSSNNLAPSKSLDLGDLSSEDERGKKKKKNRICESLSRLGVYTHSAHFTSFNQKEASQPPHVFSVSENQIQELNPTHRAEMFAHNRDYLMRAYPSGRRIDSSNPDPSMFWRKGVQMVALNWQSWDEGTMLNEAMFAGEQGWVLKPPPFRSHDGSSDPLPALRRVTLDFKITIFAGQHIPLPLNHGHEDAFYPYVKCELHVDKLDGQQVEHSSGLTKEGKYKRVTKPLQGTHPDFGKEGAILSFLGVPNVIEELSFVRYVCHRPPAW
jgi:phosphatidylinositol phospholipase C, delta